MDTTELIALLQKKTGGSAEETQKNIDAMIEVLTECLSEGDVVKLPGIGSLKVVDKTEHKERNPQTGEEIIVPAKKTVTFNSGKILREMVKSFDFITKNV